MTDATAPSEYDVRRLVEQLGDITKVLERLTPATKAGVYAGPGVTITNDPDQRLFVSEVQPIACRTTVASTKQGAEFEDQRNRLTHNEKGPNDGFYGAASCR